MQMPVLLQIPLGRQEIKEEPWTEKPASVQLKVHVVPVLEGPLRQAAGVIVPCCGACICGQDDPVSRVK